jgi:hypothetical protein
MKLQQSLDAKKLELTAADAEVTSRRQNHIEAIDAETEV